MKKLTLFLITLLISVGSYGQIHINREWAVQNGNPLMLQWSNSMTTLNSDLINIGNTTIPGEGSNVLLTRFDNAGTMLWQQDFNSAGTANDFGIALTEDNNGNIYVVGTTDNNSLTNFDLTILKYNSTGTLLWSKIWSSPHHLKDIGT
ncbi:MAG TPA: SBBP repeat-containing protein, partial [Brumimicrobium sp.]|nr:SBBP repeat-containing protein [Brumimicrobium sp.]